LRARSRARPGSPSPVAARTECVGPNAVIRGPFARRRVDQRRLSNGAPSDTVRARELFRVMPDPRVSYGAGHVVRRRGEGLMAGRRPDGPAGRGNSGRGCPWRRRRVHLSSRAGRQS
jgi:hypothetical protein